MSRNHQIFCFYFSYLAEKLLIWRNLLLVRVCNQRDWPTSIVVEAALSG